MEWSCELGRTAANGILRLRIRFGFGFGFGFRPRDCRNSDVLPCILGLVFMTKQVFFVRIRELPIV